MRLPPRIAIFGPLVAACALTTCGCGLPRHLALRPDYDLPQGFSGTYRFGLVTAGAVPAGPTDREALARWHAGKAGGPPLPAAGPFHAPLPIDSEPHDWFAPVGPADSGDRMTPSGANVDAESNRQTAPGSSDPPAGAVPIVIPAPSPPLVPRPPGGPQSPAPPAPDPGPPLSDGPLALWNRL